MAGTMERILVFHDLSPNPVPVLSDLIRASKSQPVTQCMLARCTKVVRRAFAQLASQHPQQAYSFQTLHELIRLADAGHVRDSATWIVLNTVAQLACFAQLAEENPILFSSETKTVKYVGLCTGVLAAVAAASATSQAHLLELAEKIVVVALRLGLEADRRAQSIDPNQGPWAFVAMGLAIEEAEKTLRSFNADNRIPSHNRAFVSAALPSSVTISGPSSTLQLLRGADIPALQCKQSPLSIGAPFHAPHLPCPDVDSILAALDGDTLQLRPNALLIPGQGAVDTTEKDGRKLLHHLITDCFQARLVLDASNRPQIESQDVEHTCIFSIQPSGAVNSVRLWLDEEKKAEHLIVGAPSDVDHVEVDRPENIAIVGMAGRFPNADTLDEFWEIIISGKDVHQYIPRDRFDVKASYDETAASRNSTANQHGCFMKQPGAFDNKFFNISPREAKQIDPQQRIALMVTQEALQMAGFASAGNKRIGTFFGQATDDWRESHTRQDVDIYYVGGGMRAFGPGRLNYHFKWDGPSYSVDAACSSSLAAVELASKAIASGDCDLAIAGGGNLCSALPMFSGLSKGRFTSPSGSCKTFCSTADGYCRGEAVGVVVLQRHDDAIIEKRNIKGIVAGIMTNHSAKASSITHPHVETQVALMRSTLGLSGIDSSEVDYVELHGTGTQAGDVAEMSSVSQVFGQDVSRSFPLCIGAVKANAGHGEAAAGITSLIKALLMLEKKQIPPHCGIKSRINPKLEPLMTTNMSIPNEAQSFTEKKQRKSIMINNFNATGGNTCMVLTEAKSKEKQPPSDPRSHSPISISGKTPEALWNNLERLELYLNNNSHASTSDMSYTTTARQSHYPYRIAIATSDPSHLAEAVSQKITGKNLVLPGTSPRIAFVFAGQGTQTSGIAKELFETSASFRSTLQGYETLCLDMGFPKFVDFLITADNESEWSAVQLQLATVAVELALTALWQSWGFKVDLVIGHSIGEYPALCTAGVLSLADTFYIVGKRAQLIERLCSADTHAMMSAHASQEDLDDLDLGPAYEEYEVACYNSRDAVTLSGRREPLEKVHEALQHRKIKCKFLSVRYGFHSSNMEPMLHEFESIASSISYHKPKIPVFSTLLGEEVVEEGTFSAHYLVRHARQPVNFVGALDEATSGSSESNPGTIWIELGPGPPSCLPLIKSAVAAEHRAEVIGSLDARGQTWQTLAEAVSKCYEHGVDIDWAGYHKDYEQSLSLLDMPKYAFDLENFWIPLQPAETLVGEPAEAARVSSLLHVLDDFSRTDEGANAKFSTSLLEQDIFELIHGHLVLGQPLCPSSVYCAMAFQAVLHFQHKDAPGHAKGANYELGAMDIKHPLILPEPTKRDIFTSVNSSTESGTTSISFATCEDGKQTSEHATCSVKLAEESLWRSDWARVEHFVLAQMQHVESSPSDKLMRLSKNVLYKLFTSVVDYDSPFRGIQKIVLDNQGNEAVAEVSFERTDSSDSEYDVYLIDSIMHFAGFILNNGIDDTENAFISDGWDSLRVPSGLEASKIFKFYTRLLADDAQLTFRGDVYVLCDNHVVASCFGVRFRKMKLRNLQSILSRQAASPSHLPMQPKQEQGRRKVEPAVKEVNTNSKAEEILQKIVAEESGAPKSKIKDQTSLEELGLDSILMMAILNKIKSELGCSVASQEASASLTFGHLKELVLEQVDSGTPDAQLEAADEPQEPETRTPSPTGSDRSSRNDLDQSAVILQMFVDQIAEQADVTVEQVEKADNFTNLGIDSLLALDIIDAIRAKTSMEFTAGFLSENPSYKRLQSALSRHSTPGTTPGTSTPRTGHSLERPRKSSQPSSSASTSRKASRDGENASARPAQCRMRLVQGSAKSKTCPLFCLPPGDGTPAIYARFPQHPDRLTIYSPQSPWADDPDNPENSFVNVSRAYCEAIRSTYPSGPYQVAGYSVGGAYAYEVTRLLLEQGCEVASLVIIDCPAPTAPLEGGRFFSIDAATMVGYADLLNEAWPGIPRSRIWHTAAAAREFNRYEAKPLGERRPRHVLVIWSTQGVQESFITHCVHEQRLLDAAAQEEREALIEERRKQADLSWCYVQRTDFGPQGWDKLLGDDVSYEVVDGDHHHLIFGSTLHQTVDKVYGAVRRGLEKEERRG